MGQDPVSPAWAPFTPTQSMPAKALSSGERWVLLKGLICSQWSSWSRFGDSHIAGGPSVLPIPIRWRAQRIQNLLRNCLWFATSESGNRSQVRWTQTHLWELKILSVSNGIKNKLCVVWAERLSFLFLSCIFFPWVDLKRQFLMTELLNTQKHWPNLAPVSEHFTVQFRAKVRGQQSFQGKTTGARDKLSSSCFREEVLKLFFFFPRKPGKSSNGSM